MSGTGPSALDGGRAWYDEIDGYEGELGGSAARQCGRMTARPSRASAGTVTSGIIPLSRDA